MSRYVTGLGLIPNKPRQEISGQPVWPAGKAVSQRAMHNGRVEALADE